MAIIIPCILILLIGVFAYTINPTDPKASRITSTETATRSVSSGDEPIRNGSISGGPNGFLKETSEAGLGENPPGEKSRPEYDPSSPYYISNDARKKLFNLGLFREDSMEKIFELRRKMIDRNFDSKKMSAELKKKIKSSPNGKMSKEEILSLLPEDLASDFEEMAYSNRVNK